MQPLGVDEPTVVGPYRLLGRLGSGGMGRVYLGRSTGGRTVAVKIVHPHFALDEEFRARFRREVEAARRVGGAWTAPVLDADPEAPVPWVATGYAAGPSLSAAVAEHGPLPVPTVRVLAAGLAEALAAVHDLGLVHRDVKPSNVLLTLDGPLLIDFGIARATDGTASLTSTGVSIGSPGYMSPEQILGKGVTGTADVFSYGAVLAYAATGEPPFRGDSSAALLYKVVHEQPELGALEGELREVVEQCLSKDPAARPTPSALAARLAPEGAAPLVAGGWLPGALVEQVSRSAVRLLNLETVGEAGGTAGAVSVAGVEDAASAGGTAGVEGGSAGPGVREASSGPVGFSTPSVAVAMGEFGPPPVMTPEPTDRRPGRLSVSVSASSETEAGHGGGGEGGRGRRLSCTVALAVAGAMAAVTVGSVFLFDLLPGRDENDSAGSDTSAQSPNPNPSAGGSSAPRPSASTGDSAPAGPSALPAAYLGTWEGQAVALGGTLPMGTFRLTAHRADVGEELGTLRHTDALGGVCDDVLTLKQVTKKQVVATAVGAESNRGVCSQKAHTVRITPVGDDLTYQSDSEDSGRPEARLSKVGSG
ncbi:serine/threonine-protein kinase [Streptomyces sp. YU58]|uniref:serine/threonine-protein kinase n=1 Tax=Streptomyces sp. SX92 TaxID=3158972 RepID=UPI0027B900FB|nr:serine/threonine-protein kinase [Streptomyces coralus]WLW53006.1 serine/threonine-protein kinase [Streptomyces coralus]